MLRAKDGLVTRWQRLAMQWAVRVNEGYRRLKDPLSRATYLCELAGHPLGEAQAVAHDVLARQMQWHEELTEAPTADAIKALETEVATRLAQVEGDTDYAARVLDAIKIF